MKLSIGETATVLGKSERQVRYMIQKDRLQAVKEGGRLRIESGDLPLSKSQLAALAKRLATARSAIDKGLEPIAKAADGEAPKRQYSVTDLIVFQAGAALHGEMIEQMGGEAAPCRQLAAALALVTRGCHSFQPGDKAKRFSAARDLLSSAVAALHLQPGDGGEERRGFAERIEQELIPKVAQLVARQEKRSRRSRFEPFGALSSRLGPR